MKINYVFHYAFLKPEEILGSITVEELKEQDRLPDIEEFCNTNPFFLGGALLSVLQSVEVIPADKTEEGIIYELFPALKNPDGELRLVDSYNPLMITRPTYSPNPVINPNLIQIVSGPYSSPQKTRSDLRYMIKDELKDIFDQEVKRIKFLADRNLSVNLDNDLKKKADSNYISLVLALNRLPYVSKTVEELSGHLGFEELGGLLRGQRSEFGLTRKEWITLYLCDKIYGVSFGISAPKPHLTRDEISEGLEESARDARLQLGDSNDCEDNQGNLHGDGSPSWDNEE